MVHTGLLMVLHRLLLFTVVLLSADNCNALNIILTNDDGWDSVNTRVLKSKLTAAGHSVILSGPCTEQSGKGGALTLLKHLPVDKSRATSGEYCVGDVDGSKSYAEYAEGTPVMSALYGIDILAKQMWGDRPDLLISGPNQGNNLGMAINNSGTLGAVMIAISRGIPAIAVSAHSKSSTDPTQAPVIADVVLKIIVQLENSRQIPEPLLPVFTGLNVNFPEDLESHKGIKFTHVGWNSGIKWVFTDDLSKDKRMMALAAGRILKSGEVTTMAEAELVVQSKYSGANGLSVKASNLGDDDPDSEGNALHMGYITISTIDASIQAPAEKSSAIQKRLAYLQKQTEVTQEAALE